MKVRKAGVPLLLAWTALAVPWAVSGLTLSVVPAQDPALADVSGMDSPPPGEELVGGCMDGLFEAGFVATDARTASVPRAAWASAGFGLADAKAGFVDFMVLVWTEWAPSAGARRVWIPAAADWRVTRVSDGAVIASGSAKGPPDSPGLAADPGKAAAAFGKAIAMACVDALGKQ